MANPSSSKSTNHRNTMSPAIPKPKPKTTRLPQSTTIPLQSSEPPPPILTNNPDIRPFLSRITTSLTHSFSQRRPWFELMDRTTFSRPDTLSEGVSRIKKNFSYFRINYTAMIVVITALSLLSHPFPLFFLVCLLSAWIFFYLFRPPNQPVFLFDRSFTDRETLGILIISTILVIFLTGLVSLLISSIVFGLGVTCAHGAFRVPQEVFVDGQEQQGNDSGLLSFITGAATSAAVAAAPTIPRARV
uniref:PRA1 family protein B3-like n=1 Tax=Erigeron canadensis TaxID=72917 RepID=UPI001CB9D68D|nr:PRA1 family protein B3-like [Erigeron canadensis]